MKNEEFATAAGAPVSAQSRASLWHSLRRILSCLSIAAANSSFFILLSSFLVSCGVEDGQCIVEAEFKNFNQGELYLYNVDGVRQKMDTIRLMNGRFSHKLAIETPTTYVLVFPNYSELPVFGEPGKKVSIEGDASHLKELKVSGTELNELMTAYRAQTNEQTPPEVRQTAIKFIKEHPQSPVSKFILNRQFIQTATPDYPQAQELLAVIAKENPNSKELNTLKKQLEGLKQKKEGGTLPAFSARDINGRAVNQGLLNGQANVVFTWASWNYDSQNLMRKLDRLQKANSDKLKIVGICIDASQKDCRRVVERDSIKWSCVCDGKMWDTPALTQLGLYFVPDNIITDSRGRVIAHSLPTNEIDRKIEELLK